MDKLIELEKKYEELGKEIEKLKQLKPQYQDGLFGKFWDDERNCTYGYLRNRDNDVYPFTSFLTGELMYINYSWKNFKPFDGQWINHDGSDTCPSGVEDKLILVKNERCLVNGFKWGKDWYWCNIIEYLIIPE